MPCKIVLTPEQEQTFRRLWRERVSVAEIAAAFEWQTDTVNRVRTRLRLAPRTARTRAARREPAGDPTPEQIASMCAVIRARNMERKLAEPPTRQYHRDGEIGGRIYSLDVFLDSDGT